MALGLFPSEIIEKVSIAKGIRTIFNFRFMRLNLRHGCEEDILPHEFGSLCSFLLRS